MQPARSDFRFMTDRTIRHEPTGYMLTTYGYDDPADACWSVVETKGDAERSGNGYSRAALGEVARGLLREKARDVVARMRQRA